MYVNTDTAVVLTLVSYEYMKYIQYWPASKLYFIQYVFLSWTFRLFVLHLKSTHIYPISYIMKGVDIYKQLMTLVNTTLRADTLLKKDMREYLTLRDINNSVHIK